MTWDTEKNRETARLTGIEVFNRLASALTVTDAKLAALNADELRCIINKAASNRAEMSDESDVQACDKIAEVANAKLAVYVAKTATDWDLDVRKTPSGAWSLTLRAVDCDVLERDYQTNGEAMAAARALDEILRMQTRCNFTYEVPNSGPTTLGGEDDIPF